GAQADFALVDLKAELLLNLLRDFLGRDGAEQLAVDAGLRRDLNGLALERSRCALGLLRLRLDLIRLGGLGVLQLVHRLRVRFLRELARQKEIARVSVGGVDELALLADALYICQKYNFHGDNPFLWLFTGSKPVSFQIWRPARACCPARGSAPCARRLSCCS